MATIFSCQHCNRSLTSDSGAGCVVVCPHCNERTEVPAALAHLPSPQLAGEPAPVEECVAPDEPGDEEEPAVGKIAAAMPWVISAMAHVAVGLALTLLVCIVIDPADDPPPKSALSIANTTNARIETADLPTRKADERRRREEWRDPSSRRNDRPAGPQHLARPDNHLIGIVGPQVGGEDGEGGGRFNIIGEDDDTVELFDSGEDGAANIVYVIDRSGSMHRTFGIVREDMINSIIALDAEPADEFIDQWFHVILFADGEPIEHDASRLVAATLGNKASACEFLQEVQAAGQTDPIPALRRAFTVLSRAQDPDEGRVMFLLTDGDFPDNREVFETIAELNRNNSVTINTILFGRRTAESERVMARIADDSGGWYKFVSLDEIQGDMQ